MPPIVQNQTFDQNFFLTCHANDDQLHGRVLNIWRWEKPFHKIFQQRSWMEVAQSHAEWLSQIPKMVEWRRKHR